MVKLNLMCKGWWTIIQVPFLDNNYLILLLKCTVWNFLWSKMIEMCTNSTTLMFFIQSTFNLKILHKTKIWLKETNISIFRYDPE